MFNDRRVLVTMQSMNNESAEKHTHCYKLLINYNANSGRKRGMFITKGIDRYLPDWKFTIKNQIN